MSDLIEVLRDIAAGKRNCVGDYWDVPSNAGKAADAIAARDAEIARLRERVERLEAALGEMFDTLEDRRG